VEKTTGGSTLGVVPPSPLAAESKRCRGRQRDSRGNGCLRASLWPWRAGGSGRDGRR